MISTFSRFNIECDNGQRVERAVELNQLCVRSLVKGRVCGWCSLGGSESLVFPI